jgi:hypothetical protein
MAESQDALRRVVAGLNALRNSIPATKSRLEKEYVDEYHGILDALLAVGYNVDDLRVPSGWLKSITFVNNYLRGTTTTTGPMVDANLFIAKVEAALGYFELDQATTPIGCHASRG